MAQTVTAVSAWHGYCDALAFWLNHVSPEVAFPVSHKRCLLSDAHSYVQGGNHAHSIQPVQVLVYLQSWLSRLSVRQACLDVGTAVHANQHSQPPEE